VYDALTPVPLPLPVRDPTGRALRVALVEDDPNLQWQLARLLRREHHQVVGTANPTAALRLLEIWPADLILLSDALGGTTPGELLEAVRRIRPEAFVVFLSATPEARTEVAIPRPPSPADLTPVLAALRGARV
jgi:CheY-like chemotaxis protein